MKLLNILIICVLTFFCVATLNAEIFIWTDEKGVTHYSDHPPENVENYEVQTESQANQQTSSKKQTKIMKNSSGKKN